VATSKGCNPQEVRFIEKTKDKSNEELAADKKEKEADLKATKAERAEAEKAHKELEKKWKSKETALNKALGLIGQFEKLNKKKKSEL